VQEGTVIACATRTYPSGQLLLPYDGPVLEDLDVWSARRGREGEMRSVMCGWRDPPDAARQRWHLMASRGMDIIEGSQTPVMRNRSRRKSRDPLAMLHETA
jgi:hypothetical protein